MRPNILSTAIFVLMLLTACEQDRTIFEGPYHVRFSEEATTLRESVSGIIQIPVHIAGPAQTEDIVVSYTLAGSAREGVDFEIEGGDRQVVIPAGEYVGYIELRMINNANNILRSQDVTFTLIGVNDSELALGFGKSAIGKSHTLTIQDDCILSGRFKGIQAGGGDFVEDIFITSEDCETYRLSNWNINLWIIPLDLELTFIDNGDNTITIPEQESTFGVMTGIGSVNPITREIEITLNLPEVDIPDYTFTLIPD